MSGRYNRCYYDKFTMFYTWPYTFVKVKRSKCNMKELRKKINDDDFYVHNYTPTFTRSCLSSGELKTWDEYPFPSSDPSLVPYLNFDEFSEETIIGLHRVMPNLHGGDDTILWRSAFEEHAWSQINYTPPETYFEKLIEAYDKSPILTALEEGNIEVGDEEYECRDVVRALDSYFQKATWIRCAREKDDYGRPFGPQHLAEVGVAFDKSNDFTDTEQRWTGYAYSDKIVIKKLLCGDDNDEDSEATSDSGSYY